MALTLYRNTKRNYMKKIYLLICTISLLSVSALAQQVRTYPVTVQFNSMCCGVPDNAPLLAMIAKFKKQNRLKAITVDSIGPMGREGEYYLAFRLKEMSKAQQLKFIKEVKKTAPTLNDKGSADVRENYVLDKSDLSSRTGITVMKL